MIVVSMDVQVDKAYQVISDPSSKNFCDDYSSEIGPIGPKGECAAAPFVVGQPGQKGDQGFPGAPGKKNRFESFD